MTYPGNKRFVFTILDDTDSANRGNIEPIYRYLASIGMRTTKTVWPLAYAHHLDSPYMWSSTLADNDYVEFIHWLVGERFEITWHGPTMESSERDDVIKGLEVFNSCLGNYPSLHVNHAGNADNLYWGLSRFENKYIRFLLRALGYKVGEYSGEIPESSHYWGDYARDHIRFCRSFTFSELDSLVVNPSMPYRDENRSLVDYWFCGAGVDSVLEFEKLVTRENVNRLIEAQGICILSTHLAKGYCKNGEVRDSVKRILDYIAEKDGWFVPVTEILEWRVSQGWGEAISKKETNCLELNWLKEKLEQKLNFKKGVPWWDY